MKSILMLLLILDIYASDIFAAYCGEQAGSNGVSACNRQAINFQQSVQQLVAGNSVPIYVTAEYDDLTNQDTSLRKVKTKTALYFPVVDQMYQVVVNKCMNFLSVAKF